MLIERDTFFAMYAKRPSSNVQNQGELIWIISPAFNSEEEALGYILSDNMNKDYIKIVQARLPRYDTGTAQFLGSVSLVDITNKENPNAKREDQFHPCEPLPAESVHSSSEGPGKEEGD